MRYLCLITLLGLLNFSLPAQEKKDPLINIWLPIDVTDFNGERSGYSSSLMLSILSFEKGGKVTTLSGGTDHYRNFTYNYHSDTISFSGPETPDFQAIVIINTKTSLKLFLDSMNVVTYIPFPTEKQIVDDEKIKDLLIQKEWKIKGVNKGSKFNFNLEFNIRIQDSSIVRSEFLEYPNHLLIPQTFWLDDEFPHFWSLSVYEGKPILRIEGVLSSIDTFTSLFFIDKFESNKILLHRWIDGRKERFKLKVERYHKKKRDKYLSILTSNEWKFDDCVTQKTKNKGDIIDLGIVEDYFNDLTPPEYYHDTTLIISDLDLIQKQLVLKFNNDNTYQIKRGERIIDSGRWAYYLNQFIEITSDRKHESDGIVRGYFEIFKARRGKLILERNLKSRLRGNLYTDKSKIEVYIPVK